MPSHERCESHHAWCRHEPGRRPCSAVPGFELPRRNHVWPMALPLRLRLAITAARSDCIKNRVSRRGVLGGLFIDPERLLGKDLDGLDGPSACTGTWRARTARWHLPAVPRPVLLPSAHGPQVSVASRRFRYRWLRSVGLAATSGVQPLRWHRRARLLQV